MEIAIVRKQLTLAIARSRRKLQERRARLTSTEQAYERFLADIAVPVMRMMSGALKAEGFPFTMSTPAGSVRLTSDRTHDDFIEVALDVTGNTPEVMGRISHGRGSRVLTEERPIKPGASPEDV